MTADEILARSRQGDIAGLTADTSAVTHAVDEFVGAGDVASALELVGRRFDTGREALDRLGVALDPDDRFEFDWLAGQLTC